MTPPEYTIVRTRPFVCHDESGVQLYGDAPASAANASTIATPPVANASAGASRAKTELMFINWASIATPSRPDVLTAWTNVDRVTWSTRPPFPARRNQRRTRVIAPCRLVLVA